MRNWFRKNKVTAYALVSTPLLTLYGISPIFIFGILPLDRIVGLFVSVVISVTMYWVINWYFFIHRNNSLSSFNVALSFIVTFFSNLIKAPIAFYLTPFKFRTDIQEYFIYPIITTLALNTIILLIVNLIKGQNQNIKAETTIADLNMRKLQAENQTLMQQLQPHFLFNALSVLKSLINQKPTLAEEYSVKLSNFLRYAVDHHNNDLISLKEELSFVTNYIDLQKIRFENAFTCEIEIPDEVLDKKVPVLALQALVENAFKHNYFTEKRPLAIHIRLNEDFLEVYNNIVSLKVTSRKGTGLVNLEKRYMFFTGETIKTNSSEDHFSVQIPLI